LFISKKKNVTLLRRFFSRDKGKKKSWRVGELGASIGISQNRFHSICLKQKIMSTIASRVGGANCGTGYHKVCVRNKKKVAGPKRKPIGYKAALAAMVKAMGKPKPKSKAKKPKSAVKKHKPIGYARIVAMQRRALGLPPLKPGSRLLKLPAKAKAKRKPAAKKRRGGAVDGENEDETVDERYGGAAGAEEYAAFAAQQQYAAQQQFAAQQQQNQLHPMMGLMRQGGMPGQYYGGMDEMPQQKPVRAGGGGKRMRDRKGRFVSTKTRKGGSGDADDEEYDVPSTMDEDEFVSRYGGGYAAQYSPPQAPVRRRASTASSSRTTKRKGGNTSNVPEYVLDAQYGDYGTVRMGGLESYEPAANAAPGSYAGYPIAGPIQGGFGPQSFPTATHRYTVPQMAYSPPMPQQQFHQQQPQYAVPWGQAHY
jgi:hypothetical protein